MNEDIKVIGIELEGLRSLIREVFCEELWNFESRLKQQKLEENPIPEKLMVNDVAKLLGVTRHTISTYHKKGIIPKAKLTFSGRPYWSREEIIKALRDNDLAWKYNL